VAIHTVSYRFINPDSVGVLPMWLLNTIGVFMFIITAGICSASATTGVMVFRFDVFVIDSFFLILVFSSYGLKIMKPDLSIRFLGAQYFKQFTHRV
jgi:hypothetical protein